MRKLIKQICSTSIYLMAFSLLFAFSVACSEKEEFPVDDDKKVEIEDYVVETEDKLTVVSDLPAYVFPHNYEGFGLALVNRLNNKVSIIDEENEDLLATIVVHSSKLISMGEDFEILLFQMMLGNNIVIIEPTLEDFRYFCTTITALLEEMIELDKELDSFITEDLFPGLRQTFEGFYEMSKDDSKIESMFLSDSDSQGVFAEAIAVRGCHFHIVDRLVGVADNQISFEKLDTLTNTIVPNDNPLIEKPEGGIQKATITPYTYGLFADMFTDWINKQEYYLEDMEEMRTRGANTFKSRSETTKFNLEDICTVQKVEYTILADQPSYIGAPIPVHVSFEICSVYMEDQNSDYYCIYKQIISYNQFLYCGPEGSDKNREWRTSSNFGYYKDPKKFIKYPYYGPFMRNIYSESICHTNEDKFANTEGLINIPEFEEIKGVLNANIEKYSPMNSIGSSDVTHGFSYGFDGGLYLAKEPALNLGFSVSWDSSTTKTVSDLQVEASSYGGKANWKYLGQNLPEAYFNLVVSNSHSFAPEIMRTECPVDQSWILKIPNPTGYYRLLDQTTITTSVMYYTTGFMKCYTEYVNADTKKRVSFLLMPPPRYEQKWTMHVTPSENEEKISTLHERFWIKNGKELRLPDSSKESRISITEFINDFKQEMENKRSSWERMNLYGTYTFTYINDDNHDEVEFTFDVKKP